MLRYELGLTWPEKQRTAARGACSEPEGIRGDGPRLRESLAGRFDGPGAALVAPDGRGVTAAEQLVVLGLLGSAGKLPEGGAVHLYALRDLRFGPVAERHRDLEAR